MSSQYLYSLQENLRRHAEPKSKAWWERYVNDSAPFLGVKMPVIRTLVHKWHADVLADRLALEQQFEAAVDLLRETYTEEKLAGAIFLQEILLPARIVECPAHLAVFAKLFEQGYISDWNICDWFCVKVLGPMIDVYGSGCAETISAWREAPNLWQARASLVAFVRVAGDSRYYHLVEQGCKILVRRPERFAKTAVGWILRDISRYDEPFVRRLIETNLPFFSRESIKNASKYFPGDEQKSLLQRWKEA